jgi:quercetin dioxygenase-like cupin family protein
MTNSFEKTPPLEIVDDAPVASEHAGGTPEGIAPGYHLGSGEGPAIWFQGGIITMKARQHDTDGQFGLTEWHGPRGMVAPGHIHEHEAEGFYIVEGNLDIGVGDAVYHATPGDYIYVPKQTVHDWIVTSASCKFLVFIIPGGFEHFFEELADPALSATFPYTTHVNPTLEQVMAAGSKYGWSPGHGPNDTESSAPPALGRLETER